MPKRHIIVFLILLIVNLTAGLFIGLYAVKTGTPPKAYRPIALAIATVFGIGAMIFIWFSSKNAVKRKDKIEKSDNIDGK